MNRKDTIETKIETKIETEIELKAPFERVWKALIDSTEFGQWFGVKFEVQFQPGKEVIGQITMNGHEQIPDSRRDKAFRMNEKGWGMQIKNIANFLNQNV